MAHWKYEEEREDGSEDDIERAAKTRQWLRKNTLQAGDIGGQLMDLEGQSPLYYLGLDYDEDCSDIDDMGPY